jgi:hypothetical protein
MFGWSPCGFHRKRVGTHYAELVFLHPVRSVDHLMRSGVSGAWNAEELFFMLGWARFGSQKKHIGTRYVELVFLYPVRFGTLCILVHPGCERSMHYFSLR